jgi:hypothetical protein
MPDPIDWFTPEPTVLAVHEELVEGGQLAPLELGGSDEMAWLDCELASFAEYRLGDGSDPRGLDSARRANWQARATTDELWPPSRRQLESCFWLLDAGRRVGTIALGTTTLGGPWVRVSSVYLFRPCRGRGLARRHLERVRDALGRPELGLRLSSCWSWQPAVRLYLGMGMWLRTWKRDLEFRSRAGEPAPVIDVGVQAAELSIIREGRRVSLVAAQRVDDRLALDVRAPGDELAVTGATTLALALAVNGWPLVRSTEHWDRLRASDAGAPEGLAHRIELWEAWERDRGWLVDTPRIAGLGYPT